ARLAGVRRPAGHRLARRPRRRRRGPGGRRAGRPGGGQLMADTRDVPDGELALMLADDIERVVEAVNLDVRRRTPRKLICMSPAAPDRMKLEVELAPIRGKWN